MHKQIERLFVKLNLAQINIRWFPGVVACLLLILAGGCADSDNKTAGNQLTMESKRITPPIESGFTNHVNVQIGQSVEPNNLAGRRTETKLNTSPSTDETNSIPGPPVRLHVVSN